MMVNQMTIYNIMSNTNLIILIVLKMNATKFTIKKVNDYYTFQFDDDDKYLSTKADYSLTSTKKFTNNCKFKLKADKNNVIFKDTEGVIFKDTEGLEKTITSSDSTDSTDSKTISKPDITSIFYIKNKSKFLERHLDYSTKKYSLTTTDSDKSKIKFEITKDENKYYIKINEKGYNINSTTKTPSEINIDKYLSVQGKKVIFVKEKEDRSSFNLIPYKNTFIIKNSFLIIWH